MSMYGHYHSTLKQANITVGDALAALNPTSSDLANYGIYAGGGGLAGAGIGALINALRGESKLKGALIGGGIGAGAGIGAKALGDFGLKNEKIDRDVYQAAANASLPHRKQIIEGVVRDIEKRDLLTALRDAIEYKRTRGIFANSSGPRPSELTEDEVAKIVADA